MKQHCQLYLQYLLPKLWLTRLAGWCAQRRMGWLTRLTIRLFVRLWRVDMRDAQHPDLASYATFNDFFTRPLRPDARPIDPCARTLVMPADGLLSQFGDITNGTLWQAKGQQYSLEALLAGNDAMVQQLQNGQFATIYLSPKDYHRIHMPCAGTLREMIHVPGQLYSVSPLTAAHIPNLFARNERVICQFDTEFGCLIQILVGATIVGSIETLWLGNITPPRPGIIQRWHWPPDGEHAIILQKGQQMGRFKLGSTVITLLAPDGAHLCDTLSSDSQVRIGQPLACAPTLPQQ